MDKEKLLEFVKQNKDNYAIQLKRNHNEIYSKINNAYTFSTFGEKIYNFLNSDNLNLGKCEICENICKFDGFYKAYRKRCSYKCMADSKIQKSHEQRKCIICNNTYIAYKHQKKSTCSKECLFKLNTSVDVVEKRKQSLKRSLIDKYGVDHPSRIEGFSKKLKNTKKIRYNDENFVNVQKAKETKLKKYGDSFYSNVDKSRETKLRKYADKNYNNRDKFKQTNVQKYGVEYPMQNKDILNKAEETFNKSYKGRGYSSEEIKNKIIRTNIEKYGTPIVTKNKHVSEKLKRTWYDNVYDSLIHTDRLENKIEPMFSKEEYIGSKIAYPFKCLKCESIFNGKIEDGKIPRCVVCFPFIRNTSKAELEIYNFLIEIGISDEEIITSDRCVLNGLELDLYIPSRKIAIEYNGIIWHSEFIGEKTKNYHLHKTEECEKQNIKLIHIFENEWVNKKEIIKSRIRHALKCNCEDKIFARRCEVKEISSFVKNNFLKTHHLQGEDKASVSIGAFHNNELVAVMTFGNLRIALGNKSSGKNEYEMYRFCLSKNVVGVAGKLLSYFIKTYDPKKIITFADRRYSGNNAFYSSIGFTFISKTSPNYYYFNKNDPYKIYHRFNFRKDQLSVKLEHFDSNLTEWENMKNNDYDRIWDCGHLKFEWNQKPSQ